MVKVRFAPSPTGKLHLGSARTAIFNWLYARHSQGKFILRIEDTDLSRSESAYTDSIIKDMKWMGMDFDEFHKQSERFDIYRSYIDKLIQEKKAYYCTCTREDLLRRVGEAGLAPEGIKYDGHCRGNTVKPSGSYIVRLDIGTERYISFKDKVKNKVSFNTKELDDYVILKGDQSPTYNFAVVIDDATMEVSHVIRGEDHITNTAKQIILYEHLGFPVPEFAHLPLVMDKDKSPLSKRKGSTNIEYYREIGILPEALLNAIARMGWSHGNDEIFTIPELIQYFDIDKLNKSNAVYDAEKMEWVNGKHLKLQPIETISKHFDEYLEEAKLTKIGKMTDPVWLNFALNVLRPRHASLKSIYFEMLPYASGSFPVDQAALDTQRLLLQNEELSVSYQKARELILAISDFETLPGLEEGLRKAAESGNVKFGDLIQALRIQLTGSTATPDILSVIRLMGKKVIDRI